MNGRAKALPEEISVKHAANGGYIVRHSFNNQGMGESYRSPEEHAFTSHKEMIAHVDKHMSKGKTEKEHTPAGVGIATQHAAPTKKTKGAGVD